MRNDVNDWVLRRPPLSHVLATANDMRREHTVQHALGPTDVPTAPMVAFCADEAVIGAPFYLMQHLEGVVYASALDVAHLDEAQSRAAADELIDVLACLHSVDPHSVGLGDFGRPDGFVARQIGRWTKQWDAAKTRELPLIDEVAARLRATVPTEHDASIVHGDYSFNNTMWWRDAPARMRAVLDWEMSTLGDPLTDLGLFLLYWGRGGGQVVGGGAVMAPELGFLTRDAVIERYAAASDVDLSWLDWYEVFASYKLAIIVAGIHARYLMGMTRGEGFDHMGAMVTALAESAVDFANQSEIASLRG